MPLVDVAEQNAFLAAYFGGDTSGIPASFDVALFTDDPTDTGVEITGAGYTRVSVANDATFWAAPVGAVVAGTATFPSPAGDWDQATVWVLFNGLVQTAFGFLSQPITASSGDPAPEVEVAILIPTADNLTDS